MFFFFQAEDGIRDGRVTGVQTCALPISPTQTPTQTNTPSNTPTSTPTITPTNTPTSTFTSTSTNTPTITPTPTNTPTITRSEERRVGKEGKSRRSPTSQRKKNI